MAFHGSGGVRLFEIHSLRDPIPAWCEQVAALQLLGFSYSALLIASKSK